MSEYQYFEFVSVDGPISDEGMRYAQGCSSRAEVSRFRWTNVCHFGDFHGDAEMLLKYYDAHFYIANWGTVRFALAFPEGVLDDASLQPYLRFNDRYEDTLRVKTTNGRCIVWWERNEEGGWGWTEGDGNIDSLVAIREELMRGDYRALFLGWLADFHPDEWRDPRDNGVLVPPIPPGLDCLTPALKSLIDQFPVDPNSLTVAAGQSEDTMPDRVPVVDVLGTLPIPEMKVLLQQVAEGDGSRVMSKLNRLTCPRVETPVAPPLTCVDFAAKAIEVRAVRLKKEAEAEEAERKRKAAKRKRHLDSVMKRADRIWAGLDPLMDQKVASAYDDAAKQLKELRAAYQQAGKDSAFQTRLNTSRDQYARRPAMMRRIKALHEHPYKK